MAKTQRAGAPSRSIGVKPTAASDLTVPFEIRAGRRLFGLVRLALDFLKLARRTASVRGTKSLKRLRRL